MRSFFLLVLALVTATSTADAFSVRAGVASESWMKGIKDDAPLCDLVLPGTHDTAAYTMDIPIAREFVVTQKSNITEQLARGIRYVDYRVSVCEGTAERLCMFHGDVYLQLNFDSALNMVTQFLAQSPSETVVMRLKYETGKEPADFQGLFETNYIKKDPSVWFAKGNKTAEAVTVGDARGKIVLLWNSGKKTSDYGYDYSLVDTRKTWEFKGIKDLSNTFEKRVQASNVAGWYENPTSGLVYMTIFGVRWFSPDPIKKTVDEMLPRATKIWAATPMKKGIVSMDYPTDELIGTLISASLDRFPVK